MEQSPMLLIVDDEPDMCWMLGHALTGAGFQVEQALSGRKALHLLEQKHFHAVFLDAKLPDFDGLELARRVREIAPDTRIIMVSGYFYRRDVAIQKALDEKLIATFVGKPFMHEEIARALDVTFEVPPNK